MRTLYFYNPKSKVFSHTNQVAKGLVYPNSTEQPLPSNPSLSIPTWIQGGWSEFNPIHNDPTPILGLAELKSIDQKAGEVRSSHVTQSPLQQQVYDAKIVEAKAYISAGYPTTSAKKSQYPLIQQEALALGTTMTVTADTIVATYLGWMVIAGKIEGIRIKAKADIKAATDYITIKDIFDKAIIDLSSL